MAISLIICTYNNADLLQRTLEVLSVQVADANASWEILVVDNNSTDATPDVIRECQVAHPDLVIRSCQEPQQGVHHARVRGAIETDGEVLAFIDDDCLLDPGWVQTAVAFLKVHPRCGALGGKVELQLEEPIEPALRRFGWALAEQNHGDDQKRVNFLVGAGLVLRRQALKESGWLDGPPLLQDRTGRDLVSGGDMEIGVRIASASWELWYEPACRIRHIIPAYRTTLQYLRRIVYGLGKSQVMVQALTTPLSSRAYGTRAIASALGACAQSMAHGAGVVVRRRGRKAFLVESQFALGQLAGAIAFMRQPRDAKQRLVGAARRASIA